MALSGSSSSRVKTRIVILRTARSISTPAFKAVFTQSLTDKRVTTSPGILRYVLSRGRLQHLSFLRSISQQYNY